MTARIKFMRNKISKEDFNKALLNAKSLSKTDIFGLLKTTLSKIKTLKEAATKALK